MRYLIPVILILSVTGCKQLESVGDSVYVPLTTTNIVETPSGNYPVVSTNGWTLNPNIRGGIELAGDVAPFPWAGLASNALIAALGIGAHFKGRKWKRAAVSGVSAAQAFKRVLKEVDGKRATEVKSQVVSEQRASGTQTLIQSILSKL